MITRLSEEDGGRAIAGNDGTKSGENIGASRKLGLVIGRCCLGATLGQGIDIGMSGVAKSCAAQPEQAGESLCGRLDNKAGKQKLTN